MVYHVLMSHHPPHLQTTIEFYGNRVKAFRARECLRQLQPPCSAVSSDRQVFLNDSVSECSGRRGEVWHNPYDCGMRRNWCEPRTNWSSHVPLCFCQLCRPHAVADVRSIASSWREQATCLRAGPGVAIAIAESVR